MTERGRFEHGFRMVTTALVLVVSSMLVSYGCGNGTEGTAEDRSERADHTVEIVITSPPGGVDCYEIKPRTLGEDGTPEVKQGHLIDFNNTSTRQVEILFDQDMLIKSPQGEWIPTREVAIEPEKIQTLKADDRVIWTAKKEIGYYVTVDEVPECALPGIGPRLIIRPR